MEQVTGISNGSVRRLLAIPGYENIAVELPLTGASDLDFWNTVKKLMNGCWSGYYILTAVEQ